MTEIMFDVIGYKTDKAPGFILKKHKNLGLVEGKMHLVQGWSGNWLRFLPFSHCKS